jgi:lipoprotein-releasing system permease protein
VTLIAPSGQVTPAGVVPRLKQMTVVGTFDSGHYEYDSALACCTWRTRRASSGSKARPASA